MSFISSIRALLGRGVQPLPVVYSGPTIPQVLSMDAAELYRTQPHLRTVVSFIARNVAQLPLHTFKRASDNDRRRVVDGPLPTLMSRPNEGMTGYDLIHRLVSDLKLYDVAVLAWVTSANTPSGYALLPIPVGWIHTTGGGTAWSPEWLDLTPPGSTGRVRLVNKDGERPEFIMFHGYDPSSPLSWASPVEALKEILAEQIQAWSYRQQIWQRGGRVGTYITRPADAPRWSDEARTKFQRDWEAKWTGRGGTRAGGTPLFEDGMTLHSSRFSTREEEWTEVAKLSLSTVASVYHVNPTMVGMNDNANYSNVREFKRMLYTDTLGPDLAMIEARLNAMLVPHLAPDGTYVEFNIAEKLQGSFEEQAAVISTSVGRPWMTADEARAKFNLAALGGDASQLVTPLNVLVGGQASARDSGAQNLASQGPPHTKAVEATATPATEDAPATVHLKATADEEHARMAQAVLTRFFKRQRAAVLARLGAKAPQWWDEDRWDAELTEDLYRLAAEIVSSVSAETLKAIGVDPDAFSMARVDKFLMAIAASRASAINATTRDQILEALDREAEDDDDDEDVQRATPEGVFDLAMDARGASGAVTLATTLAAVAVTEVGRQIRREGTTKTWNVQSGNPRTAHAAMDGETVPIDDTFSNGAQWPGDSSLDVDEVAGCMCGVTINLP